MERTNKGSLSSQMKRKVSRPIKKKEKDGNFSTVISTGSTLLDLAISGHRVRGGGLPGGILVEIFGPAGSGKTVLLCEIAGAIQRHGGDIVFNDPEARLNKQFAEMFDLDTEEMTLNQPDTVTEVFSELAQWEPTGKAKINGIMTDSLAALSTNMEMDNKEGDKMGMRRAKEFSEGLRKFCRTITKENHLMVCSNQVRVNQDAGPYGQKYVSPGGEAIGFYSSVRLRVSSPSKIKKEIKVAGKTVKRVIGVESMVEVHKNSVDAPYRTAKVIIQFDYGVDDIRANLQYLKDFTKATSYELHGEKLGQSMEQAIEEIEEQGLEHDLKEAVIDLWEEIEGKFKKERKTKKR